jgi:outer membrane protein OmpA-like peptidoglycan-associated protein
MKISKRSLIGPICFSITFVLAMSGCATKKYVSQRTNAVNQRVNEFEAKTKQQMAYLTNKQENDISQVRERIMTTDAKVSENAAAIQKASATASQAMQTAESNKQLIDANKTDIANLANSLNYTLIEKGDVTFGFNKSTLDKTAQAALDLIIAKAQSAPRAVVELIGFTDTVGSKQYNLALSRRRAEAVQRYLVNNNIPLRGISIVGLGEEKPPTSLAADIQALDPNATPREVRRAARRVLIRVYSAGGTQSEAARSTSDQ